MEQSQPCGTAENGRDDRPVASSISGAAAASLGAAAIHKLLSGDTADIGWEIRMELGRFGTARRALPAKGSSPLDPHDVIQVPPVRCQAATLAELVDHAERQVGRGAIVLLHREVSAGFVCQQCRQQYSAGPVEHKPCSSCGGSLAPIEPMTRLSRDSLGDFADAPVSCLGVDRDLLRIADRMERTRGWLEYQYRAG